MPIIALISVLCTGDLIFPSVETMRFYTKEFAPDDSSQTQISLEYGIRAYPAYVVILNDPRSSDLQKLNAMHYVAMGKGDRSAFRKFGTWNLTHDNADFRLHAVLLLREIGTADDTPALCGMLYDGTEDVCKAAGMALVKIGSRRDVACFDIWLKSDRNANVRRGMRHQMETYRDKLIARLNEEDAERKKAGPPKK
jgi:HEAT repeat protein